MQITVTDARAKAAELIAQADALTAGADAAEKAGLTEFDTIAALQAEAHAAVDELGADIDAASK